MRQAVLFVEGGTLHQVRSCTKLLRESRAYRHRVAEINQGYLSCAVPRGQLCDHCWSAAFQLDPGTPTRHDAHSLQEDVVLAGVEVVDFSVEDAHAIRAEARTRHDEMKIRRLAYGESTLERQIAGLLAERAVQRWIGKALGHRFQVRGDVAGGADVHVRPANGEQLRWSTIEVKAHDPTFWWFNGRLVNGSQLRRMKSDVLMWCVVPPPLGTRALLIGWSKVQDVLRTGSSFQNRGRASVRPHCALIEPAELVTRWSSHRG